jgi:hypothetical protein
VRETDAGGIGTLFIADPKIPGRSIVDRCAIEIPPGGRLHHRHGQPGRVSNALSISKK